MYISNIGDWYSEKNILITGATGFIGKVLLEKLLRSCPEINTIYILVRSKRGVLPEERKNAIFNCALFDEIRKNKPNIFDKVVVIKGDVSEPFLGISAEDRAVLAQNVSVVFHSAATVKFHEEIKLAVKINVLGTLEMIKLAYEMKQLKVFVHVSTAYSNCIQFELEEKLYEPPINLHNLVQLTDVLDDDTLNYLTPKLLKNWPNTYTYTKALAEHLIGQHFNKLPISIVRPSIVTASHLEPIPGWLDNISGLTGLIVGFMKGGQRSLYCVPENMINMIPVDTFVNLTITVAWYTAINKFDSIPIFNCTTGMLNRLSNENFKNQVSRLNSEKILDLNMLYPQMILTTNIQLHNFYSFLFRRFPAYVFDFFLMLLGKKTMWVHMSNKVDKLLEINKYFVFNEFKFHSQNIPKLLNILSESDRKEFSFDVRLINYDIYIKNYILGIKKFILKEKIVKDQARRNRNKNIPYIILGLIFLFIILFDIIFKINLIF